LVYWVYIAIALIDHKEIFCYIDVMRKSLVFLLLLVVLATLCSAPARKHSYAQEAIIDKQVLEIMQTWKLPGIAVALVKDDALIFSKGYGVTKLGTQEAVNENTIFAIGSCTKAFTAAALAMLVDEGKISWDSACLNLLPNFVLFDPYPTKEVTIRDLLCHRTGLGKCDLLWYGTDVKPEEILYRMRFLPLEASFRSKWIYQNTTYIAAGQIIPKVTGMSWEAFIQTRIFEPLGMKRSSTNLSNRANRAFPHASFDGQIMPISFRSLASAAPAGGCNSSVRDLARWVRMQLNLGTFDGRELISSSCIKEMHAPQMVIPDALSPYPFAFTHMNMYGLGWAIRDFRGYKMVEHHGDIDGMSACISMIPEKKVAVILLTNLHENGSTFALAPMLSELLLGIEQDFDWNSHFLTLFAKKKEPLPIEPIKHTIPSLPLTAYVGSYQSDLFGKLEIKEEEGVLHCQFLSFNSPLAHWNFDTFYLNPKKTFPLLDEKFFITFSLDPTGTVKSLHVFAEGLIDACFRKTLP
jgi:CubicO group peptidase (beta-lactamase class C family)